MTTSLRTILVPLDGSELAEQALAPAIALARASGAALHLTQVCIRYAARKEMLAVADIHEAIEERRVQEATAYLASVAERVASDLPDQVHADPVRTRPLQSPYGDTAVIVQSIRRLARRLHADLIVMATHARGGLSRAWLGSVADALVRQGTRPLLLIHPREEQAVLSVPFRDILVPLDGSALAEASLPIAQSLAPLSGARLTLLRIIVPRRAIARPAPVTRVSTAYVAAQEAEATRYLGAVRERTEANGPCSETAIVVAEQPARAIIEYAVDHDVDLIAMSTHGLGGVKRLMIGSVADKVVRGAPIPVLLARPEQPERTSALDASAE
ncbi:MAG TPA: universal stress protein [Gemmatimonadaceae bacterium]|nr:universal stress protein [Gemmatimonadaceae bacterium]